MLTQNLKTKSQHVGKDVLAVFVFLYIQEILCFEQVKNGRRKTLRQLGRQI